MKELQRKQMLRRLLYSIPSLVLLFIATAFLARGAFEVLVKERESAKTLRELEERSEILSERERVLEAKIARIQTLDGLYEAIKDKFSVAREGEHVAIIVDERRDAAVVKESGAIIRLKAFWEEVKGLWR